MKHIFAAEHHLNAMPKALVAFLMFLDNNKNLEEVIAMGSIDQWRKFDGYGKIPFLLYTGKQSLRC